MTPVHRSTTRHRQGTTPVRSALVVVALLLGLLGMHALSVEHGVVPGHAEQVGAATSSSGHAGTGTDDHGTDGSGGMGGMLVLCLAVLGAAATLLLGRLSAVRSSRWRPSRDAAVTALVAATPLVRSTGPPPTWEFSVIRC